VDIAILKAAAFAIKAATGHHVKLPHIPKQPKKPRTIEHLLRAKSESDRRNYKAKHNIMRQLMYEHPEHFHLDKEERGIVGVTHKPTKFRMHLPKTAIPDKLLKAAASRLRSGWDIRYSPGARGSTIAEFYHPELQGRFGYMVLRPPGTAGAAPSIAMSHLDRPELRGQGLGRKMYAEVMRRLPGGALSSDAPGYVSDSAKRVWQSMQRRPETYDVNRLLSTRSLRSMFGGPATPNLGNFGSYGASITPAARLPIPEGLKPLFPARATAPVTAPQPAPA
jgi:hypothetical protein